jgi:putative endonuclease
MYSTYIIQSAITNKYYIGSTKDLNKRLKRHSLGYTKSIKNKGPFKLIYFETYNTREKAYRRERQIKSYKGGQAFKKLVSQGGGVVNRNSLPPPSAGCRLKAA